MGHSDEVRQGAAGPVPTAGELAHDLTNVLGVILNYATLLEREAGDDEALAQDLAQVRAAAEQATALARRLLELARQGEEAGDRAERPAVGEDVPSTSGEGGTR
jgi:signal transduction histidine kinase